MKIPSVVCVAVLLAASATPALAQPVPPPQQDIGRHHGNLEAAQEYTRQAFSAVSRSQQDNGGDLNGHLRRAKELLDQVSAELKAAAEVANAQRR